jgi:hypothetical protein
MSILRGSSFSESYSFVDDSGAAIDTTNWVLYGEVCAKGSDDSPIAMSFTGRDDEAGTGTMSITGFSSLAVGCYSYFVRFTDAAGKVAYAARGEIKIHDDAP